MQAIFHGLCQLAGVRDHLLEQTDRADIEGFLERLDDDVAFVVKYSKGGVSWDRAATADGRELRRMAKAFERLVMREREAAQKARESKT